MVLNLSTQLKLWRIHSRAKFCPILLSSFLHFSLPPSFASTDKLHFLFSSTSHVSILINRVPLSLLRYWNFLDFYDNLLNEISWFFVSSECLSVREVSWGYECNACMYIYMETRLGNRERPWYRELCLVSLTSISRHRSFAGDGDPSFTAPPPCFPATVTSCVPPGAVFGGRRRRRRRFEMLTA